jgi:hypothetical protein
VTGGGGTFKEFDVCATQATPKSSVASSDPDGRRKVFNNIKSTSLYVPKYGNI